MEQLDINGLARYLKKDAREIDRMIRKEDLPARKVGGDWRFSQAEINEWLSMHLRRGNHEHLFHIELDKPNHELTVIRHLMTEDHVQFALNASTKSSVLRTLVKMGENTGSIFDGDAILDAVLKREEVASTAMVEGVALPHTRQPQPQLLGDSLILFGKTSNGIPYGCEHGSLTDLFFMILCQDPHLHLQVLARFSRLIRKKDFLEQLRAAQTNEEVLDIIEAAETSLEPIR